MAKEKEEKIKDEFYYFTRWWNPFPRVEKKLIF